MDDEKNNEKVERAMYESTKQDHARVQLDKISRFGLMEMSRQRIKPALNDLMGKTIWVRSVVSICESIFRLLTEKAINNKSSALLLKVSPNIANELLNRYRNNLNQIEAKFEIKILVFIDPYNKMITTQLKLRKMLILITNLNLTNHQKLSKIEVVIILRFQKDRLKL